MQTGPSKCLPNVQLIGVEKVVRHENYSRRPRVVNDISLIRLATLAVLHPGVQFACLPVDETEAARVVRLENLGPGLDGQDVTVIGWGKRNTVNHGEFCIG